MQDYIVGAIMNEDVNCEACAKSKKTSKRTLSVIAACYLMTAGYFWWLSGIVSVIGH